MGSWEGGYSKQQSLGPNICDLSVIFQWESLLVHVVSCWSVPLLGDGPYIMPPALMVLSVSGKQWSRPDKIVGLTWLAQIESYFEIETERFITNKTTEVNFWKSNYSGTVTVNWENFAGQDFVENKIFMGKSFADCSLVPKFCREIFPKWPQNFNIYESFLSQKFPAIWYSLFLHMKPLVSSHSNMATYLLLFLSVAKIQIARHQFGLA